MDRQTNVLHLFLYGSGEISDDVVFPANGLLVRDQQLLVPLQLLLGLLQLKRPPAKGLNNAVIKGLKQNRSQTVHLHSVVTNELATTKLKGSNNAFPNNAATKELSHLPFSLLPKLGQLALN